MHEGDVFDGRSCPLAASSSVARLRRRATTTRFAPSCVLASDQGHAGESGSEPDTVMTG